MIASRFALRSSSILYSNWKPVNSTRLVNLTYRNLQTQAKSDARRSFKTRFGNTVKAESSSAESLSPTPLVIGRGLLTGGSALGLGALVYYGLGMSNQAGILEKSTMWPQLVRDRIKSTYQYVFSSLGVTALSTVAIFRSPTLMNLASKSSITAALVSIGLVIGSGAIVRSIPYDPDRFGTKQLAWVAHCALLGGFIAPLAMLGGQIMIRAAVMTAGIVGGLSLIAATAPSEKFLNMAGPLSIGLGVVFASSIGSMFLPPTTRLGLSLYSMSLYGGLLLFSMFLLYDTQKIVKHAENHMVYDPVNESVSIYLDILNIFIRMATILGMGNNRRK